MPNPKVLDDFLNGEPAIKTAVTIPTETIINLMVGILIMLVLAFMAYKLIVKK